MSKLSKYCNKRSNHQWQLRNIVQFSNCPLNCIFRFRFSWLLFFKLCSPFLQTYFSLKLKDLQYFKLPLENQLNSTVKSFCDFYQNYSNDPKDSWLVVFWGFSKVFVSNCRYNRFFWKRSNLKPKTSQGVNSIEIICLEAKEFI